VLLSLEGLPTQPLSLRNVAGFAYLALIGTALAYTLWFRGIQLLPVGSVAFLGRCSARRCRPCGLGLPGADPFLGADSRYCDHPDIADLCLHPTQAAQNRR